jgi:hypothetical protein
MKAIGKFVVGAMTAACSMSLQAAPEIIDTLVVYVDEVTGTSNGRDINARIASYIEYSNQAYQNSDVDMQLRLVGIEALDEPLTYVESANLQALRNNTQVAAWRQQYGADLVTLINLRKPMNGGYVCGIGYIPPGDASTGEFYSNAHSLGFSLVGVDCGYNTFTHELGHNMSLGHSYEQNSEGGIYPWARGHGEHGLFSTVMAYPQVFGTNNQLQQFSSPDQTRCEGLACGVDKSQADGADSVGNLRMVARQVAAFTPSVSSGGEGGSGTSEPPICSKPEMEANLLEDGDFNSLSAWSSFSGAADLGRRELTAECGRDYILHVSNRTQFYGGPFQDISAIAEAGVEYRLTAKLAIAAGATRDDVRAAIQVRDDSGTHYQYLPSLSVAADGFTAYDETFTLDVTGTLHGAGLLLYGPQAEVEFYADEVKLVKTGAVAAPALLVDEGFENGATGWGDYLGTRLYFSRRALEGNYSLLSTDRTDWYSGPGFNVHGVLQPGRRYQASVDVYLENSSRSSDAAQLWVYYVDDAGGHWQKLVGQSVSTHSWHQLTTDFSISASGSVTQMRLHVFGPESATQIYVDNLRVSE